MSMPFSRRVRRLIVAVAAGGIALVVACLAAVIWIARPIPDALLASQRGSSTTVEDQFGNVLRSARSADGSDVVWLPYDRIDADLISAFVAVEDHRFWDHHGVDPLALARASRDNLRAKRVVSGASTITMQLARLLLDANRRWDGKAVQALWAIRLDAHLSKQQILEQYLNRVHLGEGVIGVAAASPLYFGSSASDLSVGQAAMLAGMAHAPSLDNPVVSVARTRARRDVALRRMQRLGMITREDVRRARLEDIDGARRRSPFLAPHFTAYVLSAANGRGEPVLRTTLDAGLQAEIEDEVRYTVSSLRRDGVADAAAVVLDNSTGGVLAWVGSPDFWNERNGQTDMVVSSRQPGSALKPFLYGLAIDRGYTAATVLPDIPHSFATSTGPYSPRNYDRRIRGPVRAREALASSYNVPAVDLASRVGASSLLNTLHLAGFASLDQDANFYGLGLALGDGDVTLMELANGYRALANGGSWRPWTWRLGEQAPDSSRRVISELSAAIVLDILSDPSARMPGFGPVTPFDFPFPVAVKTGTSRHFTDNWAVGTTGRFTVAVWAGNFTGKPMQGVSGVTGAGPLLHRAVMAAARRYPPGLLTTPAEAGAIAVNVCRLSGLRATSTCPSLREWFRPGTEPTRIDDWEHGPKVRLPAEYATWNGGRAQTLATGPSLRSSVEDDEPTAPRPSSADSAAGRTSAFRILSPLDGDRYSIPPGIDARYATIALKTSARDSVHWIIDGSPYDGERWSLRAGDHVIQAVATDGRHATVRIAVDH
jgi:penicillin-binding protein 1C